MFVLEKRVPGGGKLWECGGQVQQEMERQCGNQKGECVVLWEAAV